MNGEEKGRKRKKKKMSSLPNFEAYIRSQDAKSTIASNRFASSAVSRFFSDIGEKRDVYSIPPNELDGLLARFFMEVRKKDGKNCRIVFPQFIVLSNDT